MRDRLEAARDRLARLRSELATARRVLAARLVEIYKSDAPDALTVVLEADGFGDLLERTEFLERISDQDREITDRVRGLHRTRRRGPGDRARRARAARAARRGADPPASATRSPPAQDQLVSSRDQLASARADKPRRARAACATSRDALEGDLASLEAEQARVASRAPARRRRPPGPIKQGSGQLIWPVNGPVAAPSGCARASSTRASTSRCPSGTPIRAADAGTVALMGWVGGYGNYTCIQHTGAHVHLLRPPVELRDVERAHRSRRAR